MERSDITKEKKPKLLSPGPLGAIRRLLAIALILFPCTWIVTAILIGNLNLLDNRSAEAYRHIGEAATVFLVTVCIVFLVSLLPSFRQFSNWLSSWRILRRVLIGLAWVVTIVALFYGEEDWRGRHGWNIYRESAAARDEELDFKAYIPKPVPDADNFAATPEIRSWFVRGGAYSNHWSKDDYGLAEGLASTDADKNPWRMTDLVAWQMAFEALHAGHTNTTEKFKSDKFDPESRANAAPAVLEALKPIDRPLEELRIASQRPECVYPVIYRLDDPWGILLPHLANIKSACMRLDLRACAELAAGQSDHALADVKLMLHLGDSLKTEPFVISYLVRLAVFHIAIHPVWEGLAEGHWSDAQLQELQKLIQQYEFIADIERPLHGERAAGILTADLLAAGKYDFNNLTEDPSPAGSKAADIFGRVIPRGWYEMEKLNYCRLFDLELSGAFDVGQTKVFPTRAKANAAALDRAFAGRNPFTTILTRHQLLSVIMLPALEKMPMKAALGQATADEAILACALERHRLAHGQFPDKLEALTPDLIAKLPNDVISGQPYKYHPPAAQSSQLVLYSVGWNEQDDGGQLAFKGKAWDPEKGDWVWTYPAK